MLQTFIECKWVLWWACGLFSGMIEMMPHVPITFFFISSNDVISLEWRPLNFRAITHPYSLRPQTYFRLSLTRVLRGQPFNFWRGRGGLVISGHQEFFFLAIWWAGYFFPFFPISFLLHLCCMQFFSSDKRLQKIYFPKSPTPSPPRAKLTAPKSTQKQIVEYDIKSTVDKLK